jgi:hypothetical protein
MFSSYD